MFVYVYVCSLNSAFSLKVLSHFEHVNFYLAVSEPDDNAWPWRCSVVQLTAAAA